MNINMLKCFSLFRLIGRSSLKRNLWQVLAFVACAGLWGNAFALPICPTFSTGAATCAFSDPVNGIDTTLTITQTSDKLIGSLDSFGVNSGEHIHLEQPAGGTALIKISTGVSQLNGTFSATGTGYLISPNGIAFDGAQLQGGLVASTLEITDVDFNANSVANSNFTGSTGSITIGDNGLMGSSPAGKIRFLAGTTVSTTGTINVAEFWLSKGVWTQNSASLPSFQTQNFRVDASDATFIRVNGGDGSTATPYQIADIYGLQGMGSVGMAGYYYQLAGDLNASPVNQWSRLNSITGTTELGFSPIANFTGGLDGAGHTISNLYIQNTAAAPTGLIGVASGATLKNITLTSINVSGIALRTGALAGYIKNATTVTNSRASSGTVKGGSQVGGLIGWSQASTITNSSAAVTVQGNLAVGGLVGDAGGASTITSGSASGTVTGGQAVGGLVGIVGTGGATISESFATGAAAMRSGAVGRYLGGLLGSGNASTTLNKTYATGSVTGSVDVGGLVGNGAAVSASASFWDTETTGQATSAVGVGKTTTELQTASTFTDWDFTNIWNIRSCNNTGYPVFQSVIAANPLPDAPSGLSATADNTESTVSWGHSSWCGSMPITNYTVTASPGGQSCTTTDTTSCTVTGLTNGTSYTFTVVATNVHGSSSVSAASSSVTPACHTVDVVTSAADSGAGSLRKAITNACPNGTITFGSDLAVQLTTAELLIDKPLTIDGVGHTVSINGPSTSCTTCFRVFNVNAGAVFVLQNLTVANGNLISGNGGGLSNSGTTTISHVLLTGNSTTNAGGGVYNNSSLTLSNVTFAGNSAWMGGGLSNDSAGQSVINNTTFAANSATVTDNANGGGLYNGGIVTLTNTLLANNAASGTGTNCAGSAAPTDSGNNLDDGTSCGFTANSSLNSAAPLLGALGSYGGTSQTFPLLPGSSAIDAGTNTGCPATDQRGITRPQGDMCDIGAFESRGFTFTKSGNSQSAIIGTAFAARLGVTVTAVGTGEPVNGGLVTFAAPSSGVSATLGTPNPATIASGAASISATANASAGSYIVSVHAAGASNANFSLSNYVPSSPDPDPVPPVPVPVPAPVPPVPVPPPVPTPIVSVQPGATSTTISSGSGTVVVVQSGSVTVTATALGQPLLATLPTGSSSASSSPAIIVTANQTGATATGTAPSGSANAPMLQLTGNTTLTVQPGAQVAGTVLNITQPASGGGSTSVTVNVAGRDITITPATNGASTQLTFTTVNIGGVPTPVLALSGGDAVSVSSSRPGTPLLSTGGRGVITAGSCNSQPSNVVSRHEDQGDLTALAVVQCYIVMPATSQSMASGRATIEPRLWAGEQANWRSDGTLIEAHLGSLEGNLGLIGDPIPVPDIAGLHLNQSPPKLAGLSQRLNADLEQNLLTELKNRFGLTRQGDVDVFGSWRSMDADAEYIYSVQPIQQIQVDTTETIPDGITMPDNGNIGVTSNAVTVNLAPAVVNLRQLVDTLHASGGSVTQQTDASLIVKLDTATYAVQPGYLVKRLIVDPESPPGFAVDSAGQNVTWADSDGNQQTLYPVAADFAGLRELLQSYDSTATLRGHGNGNIGLIFGDQRYVLLPNYELTLVPPDHAQDTFWTDINGVLMVRLKNQPKLAQGFMVLVQNP